MSLECSHCECDARSGHDPDCSARPRFWYVSCIDAGRHSLVLGPFKCERACRLWAYSDPAEGGDLGKHVSVVNRATDLTGGRAWFYSWGMAGTVQALKPGVLNEYVPGAKEDMEATA